MMFDPAIDRTTAADDIDFWRGLFITAADAYDVAEKNGNPTWQQAKTLNQTQRQYTHAVKANDLR